MDESRGTRQLEQLRSRGGSRSAGRDAAGHTALIEFEGVGHTYRSFTGRSVRAVDGFSLTIGESEVFGLAGPNGAGKSTLISLLLGYLEPSDGTVRISGIAPRTFVEQHGIGYLSELISIPPRWSLEEALRRFGILAGVRSRDLGRRVEESIALLGLDE